MDKEAVFKKLQFHKAGEPLIVNAPAEYIRLLEGIRYDNKPSKKKEGAYDFVQIFARSQAELLKLAKEVAGYGKNDCYFWACYPKGTGKIKSDIRRETVWEVFEAIGLQAVSSIAIDDTWTALRARPEDKVGK